MKILFLGDIVGRTAREKIASHLPDYLTDNQIDFTIINAENAASGFGITKKIAYTLFDAGADALTMGNHTWDNRDIYHFIDQEPRIIRPTNYPDGTPGKGSNLIQAKNGKSVFVMNLLGTVFMHPILSCPFRTLDNELSLMPLGDYADAIIVDMHAEATSEKQALGYYADGRVSAVLGTHTHVPTADERLLPKSTAFQTDVGMCGVYDSIVGMDKEEPIHRFLTKMNSKRYEPANGTAHLCGAIITLNSKGLAESIQRIKI